MLPAKNTKTLNFVVVGEVRSGTSIVATSLNSAMGAVCHLNLLHDDEAVRHLSHEEYFGEPSVKGIDEHWAPSRDESPYHYLTERIFDRPCREEHAVGVRIPYHQLRHYDLFDLLHDRLNVGDFCVVHVVRNPLACFVSWKQARQSRQWARPYGGGLSQFYPNPVSIEIEELRAFIRAGAMSNGKVPRSGSDVLRISYRDLFMDLEATLRKVYSFLELESSPARPAFSRLRNRPLLDRIANLDRLRASMPAEIGALLAAEDLF